MILTVDNGDFIFLDCAYEELLQSLGPINDTASVPWTMFNDNVSMGFFDVYDQYILNILYDPAHQGRHDGRGSQRRAARGAGGRAGVGAKVNGLAESRSVIPEPDAAAFIPAKHTRSDQCTGLRLRP